ncbi:hypothetical protein ACFL2H_11995 [Planctomycetota bacterium]
MKRLALPVVLSVVFATSGSPLFAACGVNGCNAPPSSDCGCQDSRQIAPPVYHNTQFPGTCRDCKNEFAYSLWADYCQTKRHGPAYRIPRRDGCSPCGPALGGACGTGCEAGHGIASGNAVEGTVDQHQHVQRYPTAIDADAPSPIRYGDTLDVKSNNAEVPHESERFTESESAMPPEPTDYAAPHSDASSADAPVAEVDETDVPENATFETPSEDRPTGQETEEGIRRSIDNAIERALESGTNRAPNATNDELEDRSAKHQPSLFRIFRPRN